MVQQRSGLLKPSYFLLRDRAINAVVLLIRGTQTVKVSTEVGVVHCTASPCIAASFAPLPSQIDDPSPADIGLSGRISTNLIIKRDAGHVHQHDERQQAAPRGGC